MPTLGSTGAIKSVFCASPSIRAREGPLRVAQEGIPSRVQERLTV